MRTLIAAALVFSVSPAFAAGINGAWCSPEDGEMYVNRDSIEYTDHSCPISAKKTGKSETKITMTCSGDDGGDFTQNVTMSLRGKELTVTGDKWSVTYTRCPN